jgi:hypothetical protein
MSKLFIAAVALALLVPALRAQQSPAPPSKPPSEITLTGCVSAKPDASGRYTFADADGVSRYELKGRKLSRWAGQRVQVVGGRPDGGGLAVSGGLQGPIAGARGTALDPSQESVKRQPGGGGAGIGPRFPEFRVSRVKAADGACEQSGAR